MKSCTAPFYYSAVLPPIATQALSGQVASRTEEAAAAQLQVAQLTRQLDEAVELYTAVQGAYCCQEQRNQLVPGTAMSWQCPWPSSRVSLRSIICLVEGCIALPCLDAPSLLSQPLHLLPAR